MFEDKKVKFFVDDNKTEITGTVIACEDGIGITVVNDDEDILLCIRCKDAPNFYNGPGEAERMQALYDFVVGKIQNNEVISTDEYEKVKRGNDVSEGSFFSQLFGASDDICPFRQ